MNDLEKAREQIDKIDKEMISLFEKRMALVKDVIEYKKKNNLDILDSKREDEIIKRNVELVTDKLKPYYKEFFNTILCVSKEYQKNE